MADDLSRVEKLVEKYLKEDNKSAAVKLLFDLTVKCAEKGDFARAEALRERLGEVDPTALTEIVKSGEIIEEAQRLSIDQDRMETWSDLFNLLTAEETSALYHAMTETSIHPDEPVFRQGDRDTNLYFLHRGYLGMTCRQGDEEVLLKTLSNGDIVGGEGFFENSVCTFSVTALSSAKLYFVERIVLEKWQRSVPALALKIHDYCLALEKADALLEKKGFDRRRQKRLSLSQRGLVQILDSSGKPMGSALKVRMEDISSGGFSFFYKISKEKTARLLLGRKMNLKLDLPAGGRLPKFDRDGTVVAVRSQPFNDCSIHVRFDEMLSEDAVREMARLFGGGFH